MFFYVLDINPLSHVCLANIFFQSVVYFQLIVISFAVRNTLPLFSGSCLLNELPAPYLLCFYLFLHLVNYSLFFPEKIKSFMMKFLTPIVTDFSFHFFYSSFSLIENFIKFILVILVPPPTPPRYSLLLYQPSSMPFSISV